MRASTAAIGRRRQDPRRCDLSAGIVTDDAAGTVTFHLAHPDPDFLYKLALILAVPASGGAPDHAINHAPLLPGAGPYMISRYRPKASLTLVRNPYFRQWSYAAKPAGYPSVIKYEQVTSQRKQESAVIADRADLAELGGNNQSLAIRYPTRVHVGLKMGRPMRFSTPASRRLQISRSGKPSTTRSIGRGSSSSATLPTVRPRRPARCSRPISPGINATAPTRPAPRTAGGMARICRKPCAWCAIPAQRTCR